jgi:peroxiredoxin
MRWRTMPWWIRLLISAGVLVAVPVYAAPAAQPAGPKEAKRTPAASPATTQAVAPEVRAVLEKVRAAYGGLDALKVSGTLASNLTIQGKPQKLERKFSGSFQAPNKFRHQFADDLVIGSTGEMTYAHDRIGNSYLLADAPAPAAPVRDLPRPLPEMLQTQNPSLLLALDRDPLANLTAMGSTLEKLPDAKVGDTSYTALGTTYPGGVRVTLLFDPKTHLLRRMTATMPKEAAADGPAATGAVQVENVVLDYTTIDTSPTFDTAHFAWSPPEGATDVAAARPKIEQMAAQKLVGQSAPDFKLTNLKGETVSLSDLKGQTILLDFWASWCPPCVESLPHLGRLYGQKQDGVKVLAINLMEDKGQVDAFAKAHNIDVPILLDQSGEVAKKYNVGPIPQTVLVGPDGQVKRVFVGLGPDMYAQLNDAIEQIKGGGDGSGSTGAAPAAAKTTN